MSLCEILKKVLFIHFQSHDWQVLTHHHSNCQHLLLLVILYWYKSYHDNSHMQAGILDQAVYKNTYCFCMPIQFDLYCNYKEWSWESIVQLLNGIQRLTNVLITGAMPSTPGVALDLITGNIPIKLWLEEEAAKVALRLKVLATGSIHHLGSPLRYSLAISRSMRSWCQINFQWASYLKPKTNLCQLSAAVAAMCN